MKDASPGNELPSALPTPERLGPTLRTKEYLTQDEAASFVTRRQSHRPPEYPESLGPATVTKEHGAKEHRKLALVGS